MLGWVRIGSWNSSVSPEIRCSRAKNDGTINAHVSIDITLTSPQLHLQLHLRCDWNKTKFYCFLSIEVTHTLVRLRMCHKLPTSDRTAPRRCMASLINDVLCAATLTAFDSAARIYFTWLTRWNSSDKIVHNAVHSNHKRPNITIKLEKKNVDSWDSDDLVQCVDIVWIANRNRMDFARRKRFAVYLS